MSNDIRDLLGEDGELLEPLPRKFFEPPPDPFQKWKWAIIALIGILFISIVVVWNTGANYREQQAAVSRTATQIAQIEVKTILPTFIVVTATRQPPSATFTPTLTSTPSPTIFRTATSILSPEPMLLSDICSRRRIKLSSSVYDLAISDDNKWVGIATTGKIFILLEVASCSLLPLETPFETGVFAIAFSPDSQQLAIGLSNKTVILWDIDQQREITRYANLPGSAYALAFHPGGKWLAVGADQSLLLINLETPSTLPVTLSGHTSAINDVVFTLDGQYLYSTSDDRTTRQWNMDTQTPGQVFTGENRGRNVAINPDGSLVASSGCKEEAAIGCVNGQIILWHVESGDIFYQRETTGSWFITMDFTRDGKYLAIGEDFVTSLWSIEKQHIDKDFALHEANITNLDVSYDGQLMVSVDSMAVMRIITIDKFLRLQ